MKIFVEGGWLNTGGGSLLGKGILYFDDWESLLISRFDPFTQGCSEIKELPIEPLKDVCEQKFLDSMIYLYGFGKVSGYWMEWKIQKAKVHAEFEQ